ncbi:hypothetical protein PoMZ_08161 [Pyricularia oryzae]|uniref:cAMP-independent regulatory protein pac2 n=1 Tax=Pyricularia oryzae TaxID=318829 RepID=A0A4P7NH27_PYROR|nr:hypothetical protein PoMZ_08161 [Pyricularia oryzae]
MMETYHGFVRTPADAIKLFEACRVGLLPRVQRRLSEKERQSIRSGSVFVWDEREAGMRRWTDGKSWSASRVSGSFLTYREMEGKRGGGFGNARRGAGKTPDSGRGSDGSQDETEPDGYRYKADGLMKQSFSITTSTGQHLHLISYYSRPMAGQAELTVPTADPNLRQIYPEKGLYPESSMSEAQVPPMTRAPMQQAPYMAGPPHHLHPGSHTYPPHYVQHAYPHWPASPATPPYTHYTVAPPAYAPPHHAHMHPHAPPPGHYPYTSPPPPQAAPQFDRTLPPPVSTAPQSRTPPLGPLMPAYAAHRSPRLPQPRPATESQLHPHHIHDPRHGAAGNRTLPGPLPALPPANTPPTRHASVSPPRSSHSDSVPAPAPSGNKASISALLHPTTEVPRSTVDGGTSAGNSPRLNGREHTPSTSAYAMAAAALAAGAQKQTLPSLKQFNEDVRALGALDKKFMQTTSS